ncbi:MAG: 6,7-dimethyl-8-ribityllumazine synthase [Acidimicrobiales bacterium]
MKKTASTEIDPEAIAEVALRVGTSLTASQDGRGRRIGVAAGRFNGAITLRLLEGALGALTEAGVERRDVVLAWAPGAFEIPLLAQAMIGAPRRVDAVIALGAVIRGDTGHYDLVAGECARGIQDVQLATGVPVVFGVLTTENLDQALVRSLPDHTNKGREAALTALEMISLVDQLSSRS